MAITKLAKKSVVSKFNKLYSSRRPFNYGNVIQ